MLLAAERLAGTSVCPVLCTYPNRGRPSSKVVSRVQGTSANGVEDQLRTRCFTCSPHVQGHGLIMSLPSGFLLHMMHLDGGVVVALWSFGLGQELVTPFAIPFAHVHSRVRPRRELRGKDASNQAAASCISVDSFSGPSSYCFLVCKSRILGYVHTGLWRLKPEA